jgi:hypothetical protein
MSLSQTRRSRGSKTTAPPKILFETLKDWAKGLYTRLDADRTPMDGLRVAENVKLDQDGTVTQRPGLKLYGTQPPGNVLGQIYEYVYINTTTTPNTPESWLVCMCLVGGVGKVYVNKDGGSWTLATGKTYDAAAKAHFEQVYGKILITNGVDNLSYMDIQTKTITTFTALSQPTGVSAVATGISGTNITLRYRVSAANQGETAASTAVTAGVTRGRDTWNGTTELMTFTWNRVTNASRYNIYVGDQAGSEYFLDSVQDIGSGTTQSYVDTGTTPETTTRVAPVGDSTSGPKTARSTNIKGQVFMVGDSDNQGRIWFGSDIGGNPLDFSSFNGGGWVEPNKGGKDFPVKVVPFRDGKGTPTAVCLSKGTNGNGKRYLLQPTTVTVGTNILSYMAVVEDNGQDGTDSPDGVVFQNDALWYPSRAKFNTTNTKAQIQNILSTQGISDNIATDVRNLSALYMDSCVGLAYDQCIYWALPYANTTNNQIWILDLRQKGAWMRPWYINANWLTLYAENSSGTTKFLALVNNKIYELDTNTATNDDGVAFQTSIGSGEIKFGENNEYANVLDVTFEFLKPQGNINLSVNVNTEDGLIPLTDTMTTSANQTVSGHGRFGWSMSGWGQTLANLIPVSSAQSRKKWTIEVGEETNSLSWGVTTTESGVSYQLSKVIIRYVPVGWKDLDN